MVMSEVQFDNVITGVFPASTRQSAPATDALLFRGRAADGTSCLITFNCETVVISRSVGGLPCRIRLRPAHYQAVAVIERPEGHVVHLLHDDPGLSVDLVQLGSLEAAEEYSDRIASMLHLEPMFLAGRSAEGDTIVSGSAPEKRRARATAPRRPRFLARRQTGNVVAFRRLEADASAAALS